MLWYYCVCDNNGSLAHGTGTAAVHHALNYTPGLYKESSAMPKKGATKTGCHVAPAGIRHLACLTYRASMRACGAGTPIATYKADTKVTLLEGQKAAKQEDWDRRLAGITGLALKRIVSDHFDYYWAFHSGRNKKDIAL